MMLEDVARAVPVALDLIRRPDVEKSTTGVRRASFEFEGVRLTVLEQNPNKTSRSQKPSKFALLKQAGHDVCWLVNDDDAIWYLIVDGVLRRKADVTDQGELVA